MNSFTTEKGTIYSEKGLPYAPRWFCDGRVAFQADDNGIGDINYFNPDTKGQYIVFHKRFWGGMRFYLKTAETMHLIRPGKTKILPFGFFSESEDCDYAVFTADDTIYITIKAKNDNTSFQLEFYDEYKLLAENTPYSDIRYKSHINREWQEFEQQENVILGGYTEGEAVTNICFSSDRKLSISSKSKNKKYIISSEALLKGKECVFAIGLSNKGNKLYNDYAVKLEKQLARYKAVAEKAPVLKSSHTELNRFFELAPLYHESLKTIDVEGAIRAQSTHYWVWGWDSMTSNEASFYWGDYEFIGQMLDCMEKYADEEKGIYHAFSHNMKCGGIAAPPAQGMYITMLNLYRIAGGDYKKHYAFAKKILQKIFDTEMGETGLCKGMSLYPDFRDLINEDEDTISTFNNTVCYCAVRAMQEIAQACGDTQTTEITSAFAERAKKNFSDVLYNKELKFIDSSANSENYSKRNVPTNNAVKWENNFCKDLVDPVARECLDFYEKYLVAAPGIRPLPIWCDCYDADANQLSCWWPVMSEFYTRLINKFNKPERIEQYIGWIEYWTKRLMCPEGIPCYDDNPEVPFDNWNCLSGIWHGYSVRGFYNAVVHSVFGVDFDSRGINFYPYSGDEMELNNLHFGEKTFNIRMCGSGEKIDHIVLNGENLGSVSSIEFEKTGNDNSLVVYRISQ